MVMVELHDASTVITATSFATERTRPACECFEALSRFEGFWVHRCSVSHLGTCHGAILAGVGGCCKCPSQHGKLRFGTDGVPHSTSTQPPYPPHPYLLGTSVPALHGRLYLFIRLGGWDFHARHDWTDLQDYLSSSYRAGHPERF
jgi:hypothetical protein